MSFRLTLGLALLVAGLFSGYRPWQVGCAIMLGMALVVLLLPRSRLGRALFSRHGPSLDAGQMTRQECLRSAVGFLVIAGGSIATIYGLSLLEPWLGRDPFDVPVVAMLLFMYSLFFLMGVVGATYLALRAPFRPRASALEEITPE